jgi:hypothetical protein
MPKGIASAADLEQMYASTVSVYKNKPYYVISVNRDKKALCRNLLTQREEWLPIDEVSFSAPTQRLGFINVKGSVLYLSRTPIRRYKVGLSKENLQIRYLDCVQYPAGTAQTQAYVKDMTCIELADCIMGKYPSLTEAYVRCESGSKAVAFDRQFAVNYHGEIIYKTRVVGRLKNAKPRTVADIEFDKDYDHLYSLLGNKYETILQVARSE